MSDHEPTVRDTSDQPGEALDAAKLPEQMPDKPQAALDHGTTAQEMAEGEPLDQKLTREIPDVGEGGGPEPQTTSTPILSDADEDGSDTTKDLVGELPLEEPNIDDSGRPKAPRPAEEASIHVMRE